MKSLTSLWSGKLPCTLPDTSASLSPASTPSRCSLLLFSSLFRVGDLLSPATDLSPCLVAANVRTFMLLMFPTMLMGNRKTACHQDSSAMEEVCCFIQCPEIQIYTDVRTAVNPSTLLEAVRAYKACRLTRPRLLPQTLLGTDTTEEAEQKPPSRAPGICVPLPGQIKLYATGNILWVNVGLFGLTWHRQLCFP